MSNQQTRGPARFIGAALALITGVSLMAQDGPKLAAYWDFNNTSNPNSTLDKVYGFEGLLEGGAFFESFTPTGAAGDYSVDFGAHNNGALVRIGEVPFLNAAASQDQITISFWQVTTINNSSAFWGISPSSNNGQRGIQAHTPWGDSNIYYDTAGCCDAGAQRISANVVNVYPNFGDNATWFHVVFVKDGPNKQIWINGTLFLEGGDALPLPTDFTGLILGADNAGGNSMSGAMDDFAVFVGALSPASIGQLASGTKPDALPGVPVMADPLIALAGSATGFTLTVRDSPTRQLAPASVTVQLNGATVAADVAKVGSVTTVTYSLAPDWLASGSVNTVVLEAQDTGGAPVTASLEFTVASFATLPANVRSPLGSETAAQPGFNVRTWQLAVRTGAVTTMPNNNEWAEGVLAGLVDVNIGDRTGFVNDVYAEATTINYAQLEGQLNGNFTPDRQHPGITPGADVPNYASDFVTYLVFPQAGFYTMGVNSDDNFRVTIGEAVGRQYLEVLAPASVAGGMAAVSSVNALNTIFGGPLPTAPIEGEVRYFGEGCGVDPNPITEDLTGKVALFIRGTCSFVEKSRNAQARGAIAVIIANSEANAINYPIIMGADPAAPDVTVPVMMVDYDDGQRLINNATGLRVSIGKDTNLALGEFNGNGRGASDTIFSFAVPQAGVYPFRCLYLQGNGGANVEWFTVAEDGTKILVNDTVEGAVKAYRARTFTPPVPQPEFTSIVKNMDGSLTVAWEGGGVLQAAPTVGGPWETVDGATSPFTIAPTETMLYGRIRAD